MADKFRSLALPLMGASRVEEIIGVVQNLEDLPDIPELGCLLA